MTLILNTLIYAGDHAKGAPQAEMVQKIADLGADGIELRREYFKNVAKELPVAAKKAHDLGLTINYSVPDVLFLEDGTFNPAIEGYYAEGLNAGISKIKFNIGHFENFNGDLTATLKKFADKIETNIENDQSAISGTVQPIKTFLDAVKKAEIDIKYVYDMGNWAFVNEDALTAAEVLAQDTRYIHLKNTASVAGKLTTPDDLNVGIYNWRKLLEVLPNDVEFALEYPMDDDDQVAQQMKLVNSVIDPVGQM